MARPTSLRLTQRRQRLGIKIPTGFNFEKSFPGQLEPGYFVAESPANNDPDPKTRSPAGGDESDLIRSPGDVLIDTVARLQIDMEELCLDYMCNQTWGSQTSPRRPRRMTFTSTKVPKFGASGSGV